MPGARLEPGEAESTDHALSDRPPTLGADAAAAFGQRGLWRGIDHVTLTEGFPIQAVGFVQNDFMRLGLARGTLG